MNLCRRQAGVVRVLLTLFLIGTLLIAAGGAWLYHRYQEFLQQPLALPEQGLIYTVQSGRSVRSIAAELQAHGVLSHADFFMVMARLDGRAAQIKAGEYRLEAQLRPQQLLDLFVSGKVVQHAVTLVEGWTFRQMMAHIRGNDILHHTLSDTQAATVMAALGKADEHPEGRFLPDTYHFPRGTTDIAFLKRAYQSMQSTLETAWEGREEGLPLDNAYAALTLASIIERETGVPEERAEIAGVFVRRLQRRMRLQTDPTVIYGLGEAFDGNLRKRDLTTDTPYNTYTRAGLPPTPIAMPGRDAIHAALHPAEGNTLYFVARGDGSHQFSATLAEHNRAVRKYQLKQ